MMFLFIAFTATFIFFIEFFTILYQLTGIAKSKARFQVISILTGTGFTTKESEIITSSRIRRNIAQIIMIFGFTSTATIVTLIYNFISNFSQLTLWDLLILVIALSLIFFLFSFSKARKLMDTTIEKVATRAMFGKNTNSIMIKDSYDNDEVIAQVVIKVIPPALDGKTLEQSNISKLGINMLVIERDSSVLHVTKDTKLIKEDTITLFGPIKIINDIFYKSIKEV